MQEWIRGDQFGTPAVVYMRNHGGLRYGSYSGSKEKEVNLKNIEAGNLRIWPLI